MLKQFTSPLYLVILAIALITAGCSTRKRQIEIKKPQASATPPPSGDPGGRPNDDVYASLITEIPESELRKYMDPNAQLEFKLNYAGTEKLGDIKFANGKAIIEVRELPINKTSKLVIQLLEDSVVKLEGSKDNVTLKAGLNRESLNLRVVPTTPDLSTPDPSKPDTKPEIKPENQDPAPGVNPGTQPEVADLVLDLQIESE